ncbi:type IV fimbrial biogenesis protein FimT [Alteromonadaceae bacterium Bs31]|nr:type IV fimbrial biogenesis protein FimT [Alteromonadaceae bacterium Bs31]
MLRLPTKKPSPCAHKGISLLDLLIATSIFLILTSIAVPSFSHLAKKNRKDNTVYAMLRILNFARQHAVDYSTDVLVCPTSNEQDCSGNWSETIMVFLDINNNKKLDEDERLLQKQTIITERQALNWKGAGSPKYISYNPAGFTGNQNGRIYYCDRLDIEKYRAQLVVYRTGRVRIASQKELREGCGGV